MGKARAAAAALVAALLCALAMTPGAWGKYDSEKQVTELVGTSENAHTLHTKFGTVVCQKGEFKGTQTGTDVGGGVWTSNHVTVHPEYDECKALGFNADVDTTGCDYTFTPTTKTDTTGPHAQADVVPSSGSFGNGSCDINIVGAGGICNIDVPEQTATGLVDYMNLGSADTRDVTVDSTVNSVDYEGDPSSGFCKGTGSDGTYTGATTVQGFFAGNQVGIWVTNT